MRESDRKTRSQTTGNGEIYLNDDNLKKEESALKTSKNEIIILH